MTGWGWTKVSKSTRSSSAGLVPVLFGVSSWWKLKPRSVVLPSSNMTLMVSWTVNRLGLTVVGLLRCTKVPMTNSVPSSWTSAASPRNWYPLWLPALPHWM
ncbi:hypothetical protein SGLAM104S_03736 [Streptomyces glaucescens]